MISKVNKVEVRLISKNHGSVASFVMVEAFHEHDANDLVRHLCLVDRQLDGIVVEVDASTTGVALLMERRLSKQGLPNTFDATLWTEEDEGLSGETWHCWQYVTHFAIAKGEGLCWLVAAKSSKVNEIAIATRFVRFHVWSEVNTTFVLSRMAEHGKCPRKEAPRS